MDTGKHNTINKITSLSLSLLSLLCLLFCRWNEYKCNRCEAHYNEYFYFSFFFSFLFPASSTPHMLLLFSQHPSLDRKFPLLSSRALLLLLLLHRCGVASPFTCLRLARVHLLSPANGQWTIHRQLSVMVKVTFFYSSPVTSFSSHLHYEVRLIVNLVSPLAAVAIVAGYLHLSTCVHSALLTSPPLNWPLSLTVSLSPHYLSRCTCLKCLQTLHSLPVHIFISNLLSNLSTLQA